MALEGTTVRVEAFRCRDYGFKGWRAHIPSRRGIPTPAVSEGRVFVGGGFGSHDIYALDAAEGRLLWHLRTSDDGPTATTVVGTRVVFNTESCTLYTVAGESGQIVWQRWLGDPLLAQPAIGDGKVFAVYPHRGEHFLAAFELETGSESWKLHVSHDAITAVVYAEGAVFFSTFDGRVWCVDPATGSLQWEEKRQATSAPWVAAGKVYVAQKNPGASSGANPQRARAADGEGAWPRERTARVSRRSGSPEYRYREKEAMYLRGKRRLPEMDSYQKYDAGVGFSSPPPSAKLRSAEALIGEHLVSRAQRFQGSRPVVVDGVLYQVTGDELEATDAEKGHTLWKWRCEHRSVAERALTPPAVANGRVWVGTWEGRIVSFEAATGEVRWSVDVGAPVHWQPAIAGGSVFAGLEDGSLVSFRTGDPSDDGWPMWGGGPGHNGLS